MCGKRIGRPKEVSKLREKYNLIDICPEVEAGLPVPRPPTRIVEGRWMCAGEDVTETFRQGARLAVARAAEHGAAMAVLKKGSPSGDKLRGMTAALLTAAGVIVRNL